MAFLLLGSLTALILLGMPIAFAIGLSGLVVMVASGLPLLTLIPTSIAATNSFTLLAIPFFVLAGQLMDRGGISRRIVDFAQCLVGWLRGGLGMVAVVASMFFGGVSGSCTADTAAIGSVLIPAMKSRGYRLPFACALQASAGTLGMMVPPSITMVILGVTANISIGRMFLGGIIPAVLLMLAFMAVVYLHARAQDYPREPRPPVAYVARSFLFSAPPLFTVVIIAAGLVLGIFTPTEAGVAASAYALLLAALYREISLRDLPPIINQTVRTTGMVMLLIVTSSIFGTVMTILRLPEAMATFFLSITNNPLHVFLMINILLFVIGTFLDPTPIIIILAPLLLPVVTAMHIDPVHFGVVFTLNMVVAQISPPAGVPLFVAAGIGDVPVGRLFGPVLPFLGASIVVLLIATYVPELSLFLPRLLMP